MTLGWAWLRSAAAGRVALATALAVGAGYQAARPLTLDVGSGLLPWLLAHDVYPAEGDFRWTRARSHVVVRDPGPGLAVRVEARLAGWRPPGEPPPHVALRAGGASRSIVAGQGAEVVSFETATAGVWASDLRLTLDSETFVPGGGDSRALGVRLYSVRLVPRGPALSLRRPPLRQVVCAVLAQVLAFGLLLRLGLSSGRAAAIATLLALATGAAYAVARLHAALAFPALAATLALASIAAEWFPGVVRTIARILAEAGRALGTGARVLCHPALGALAVAGALGVGLAYQRALSLEIPVGGGREALYASNFTRSGRDADGVFRQAARGAELDLRDLGGGSPWHVTVTAAAGRAFTLPVVSVGGRQAVAPLSPAWSSLEFDSPPAPVGWRSGLRLEFPAAAHPAGLRIARVTVTRRAARPSLRVVTAIVASGLLAAVTCGAAGLATMPSLVVGGLYLTAEVVALWADPVLTIPSSLRFLWIVALGAGLAALLAGIARVAAARGAGPLPPAAALAAASLGFVCWLSSMLSPLYRGGNFLFHSNVAEEIWRGAFLAYYLPYPGSMLSHQAQWGNILVPHPFLYQLLVAPLAALPQPWFHHTEKALLALFLSILALTAALLATRSAGARAGGFAGVIAALLFPTFLLLGLGHLMTLFGCLALGLALAFLTLRFEWLTERRSWWAAVVLLTLCWLSYTASLVFGLFALVLALPFLWRRDRAATRALVSAGLAAGGLAFVLYYASWTWPFLRDSVPLLLAGARSAGSTVDAVANPLWPRLARIPSKLADSYGAALIPLAGLTGLALLTRATDRIFLWSWAAVLVIFSGLDVFFNFLLKHHYATMTPIAVGVGLLLDRLWSRGAWFRWLAMALVVFALTLGVRSALDVALGRIP